MNKVFEGLSEEKKAKIINVALNEFTKNGYSKASTNEIVKEAGISKGSLFKYFSTKKSLYYYLYDFAGEIINDIYQQIDYSITDYFERLKNVGEIKLAIIRKYPEVFNFLKSTNQETDPEIREFVDKKKAYEIEKGLNLVYKGVDFTKFRDDIDLEIMLNLIKHIMLSYNEKHNKNLNSYTEIDHSYLEEWYDYFKVLRKLFYK
jgi:TetR/AcrR family transcriptional regulator